MVTGTGDRSGARVLVGLALVLALTGCYRYDGVVRLGDPGARQLVVLTREAGSRPVHGLEVVGDGRIDGQARIFLLLDGEPYRLAQLDGEFEFSWSGDWYADRAEVIYHPATASSGEIRLRYRFKGG